MTEPAHALEYEDRSVKAVYAVLLEIGQVLGAYRDKFVVIGGSVPWLLFPNAENAHIGTMDIDLCLDAEALGDGQYESLVALLDGAGYIRGHEDQKKFQLKRTFDPGDGRPVTVVVDLLMPKEAKITRNKPPHIPDFAVQRADGAQVAMRLNVEVELDGRMPDGRPNHLNLRVAAIPALLVMKGFALVGRDKQKDAYDIYYSVRQFPDGPVAVAKACEPIMDDPIARESFKAIASKFRDVSDYGPVTVRRFLEGSAQMAGMTPDQLQNDAYQQVHAWLAALGHYLKAGQQ